MSAEEPSAPPIQPASGAGANAAAGAASVERAGDLGAQSGAHEQQAIHEKSGDAPVDEAAHAGGSSSASTVGGAQDVELKPEQLPAQGGSQEDGGPVTRTSTSESKRLPLDQQPISKRAVVMFALCMATFLAALDMTIVATALPVIAQDFSISQTDYTWIGSAYMLACAGSTPPWGKISDIFGRKPIMLLANFMFFVGSLICGLSINIHMLIAGRALQGIGAGGLLALVNICIGDLFSMRSRGLYYGIIGGVWAISGAIGPILGGAFSEYVTWRWCFYINLPCDGIAFLVLLFYLKIDTPKTPLVPGLKAIDWLGLIVVVGGTLMFLFGLEYGGVLFPWNSPTVICLLVFGVTALVSFGFIEWKVPKYPLMPLRLFSNRSALASFSTAFMHGMVFMSASYYLPLYFQVVQGATPLLSGVYQFPFVLALSLGSASTGAIIGKTGHFRPLIWGGMFLLTLGFGLFIDLPYDLDWARIAPFQIIAGLGAGPCFQAPLISLQSSLHPKDMATGTATLAFLRQFASAISLVIGGVIFQNEMLNRSATLRSVLSPQDAAIVAAGSAGSAAGLIDSLPSHAQTVVRHAFTDSLRIMWVFYTVIGAIGFASSLLIRRKVLSKQHEVRKQGLEQQEKDRLEQLAIDAEKKKRRSQSRGAAVPDLEKAQAAEGNVVSETPKEISASSA